jgi:hypothetical protein
MLSVLLAEYADAAADYDDAIVNVWTMVKVFCLFDVYLYVLCIEYMMRLLDIIYYLFISVCRFMIIRFIVTY